MTREPVNLARACRRRPGVALGDIHINDVKLFRRSAKLDCHGDDHGRST